MALVCLINFHFVWCRRIQFGVVTYTKFSSFVSFTKVNIPNAYSLFLLKENGTCFSNSFPWLLQMLFSSHAAAEALSRGQLKQRNFAESVGGVQFWSWRSIHCALHGGRCPWNAHSLVAQLRRPRTCLFRKRNTNYPDPSTCRFYSFLVSSIWWYWLHCISFFLATLQHNSNFICN